MVPRGNIMTMETIRGKRAFVVGISAVSGGGKTAVAEKLSELLPDSFYLCFDDPPFILKTSRSGSQTEPTTTPGKPRYSLVTWSS